MDSTDDDPPEDYCKNTSGDEEDGNEIADSIPSGEESPPVEAEEQHVDDAAKERNDTATTENNMFIDHFTLGTPHATVRYRGKQQIVYDVTDGDQVVLEEIDEGSSSAPSFTVKRTQTASFGFWLLRTIYTLVALLLLGYHFVLCFQVFLFLFLNLLVTGGGTDDPTDLDPLKFVGTLLSIPLFVYGLVYLMSYCTTFAVDTFQGQKMFRACLHLPPVVMEWIALLVFVGIPFLACGIALALKNDNWWKITAITWLTTVLIVFLIFCLAVFIRELQFCMDLTGALIQQSNDDNKGFFRVVMTAMLVTQQHRYAGIRRERYNVLGTDDYPLGGYSTSSEHDPEKTHTGLYSRFTTCLSSCGLFDKVTSPTRRFSIAELRQAQPILTENNWSLERMYCRGYGSPTIYSVGGSKNVGSLHRSQLVSTLVCSVLGFGLMTLVLLSLVNWMGYGGSILILVAILIIFCCFIPVVRHSCLLMSAIRETDKEEEHDDAQGGTSIFQVWETVTITNPRPWYCWTRLAFEVVFLFIGPVITLFVTENPQLAVFMIILGAFSFFRIYFDAGAILSRMGSLEAADVTAHDGDIEQRVKQSLRFWLPGASLDQQKSRENNDHALLGKARTSEVLGRITHSPYVPRWAMIFVVFAIVVVVLFLRAASTMGGNAKPSEGRPPIVFANNFEYPGLSDQLKYGSCNLPADNFTTPEGGFTLVDHTLFSILGYEDVNVTQLTLDTYFGEGVVKDEDEYVRQYRKETNTEGGVYYKLMSVPSSPSVGIVSIRGTETGVDTVVNAQLWLASLLAQFIQFLIPFGWLWTSTLDNLVAGVSWVESGALRSVSYYQDTTNFVNAVLEDQYGGTPIQDIRLTGASLGGGLAVITAGQTRASAVVTSGPNIKLARNAVDPPISERDLELRTFNLVPEQDIIARIGGLTLNHQQIQCKLPGFAWMGCHSMFQSFCELQYNCGSNGRPVLCDCVNRGYPAPVGVGGNTASFGEACAAARETIKNTLPEYYK